MIFFMIYELILPDDSPYKEYQQKNYHILSALEWRSLRCQGNSITASYQAYSADTLGKRNILNKEAVRSMFDAASVHTKEYGKEYDWYEYPLNTQHNLSEKHFPHIDVHQLLIELVDTYCT